MRRWVFALVALAGCGEDLGGYEAGEELSGGETTVFDEGVNAFSIAARNLHGDRRTRFFVGNSVFKRNWVIAPSSTGGLDGLGPTFNANSCAGCHFKDGRGAPPQDDEEFLGLLVRLSVPGANGPVDEPNYGGQFNHRAILGIPAEGDSRVTYVERPGTFADGTPYSLREPTYELTNLAFGPLAPDTMFSPRTGPAMIGLGLLEAIPEADLVANADPDDADGDGISGRPNRIEDQIGRFGWKANQPTIAAQTAGAFLGDLGITSAAHPVENCPPAQTDCLGAPTGGAPEIDEDKLGDVRYYSLLLAVPVRRGFRDPDVLRGKALFTEACAGCHVPRFVTGELAEFPEVSNQTIHPYTDLLLHDMGDALADNRPDILADGREWRTPPLWGIGLVETVNRHDNLLHDGRARGFAEAILWHGGEAEAAREAFRAMAASDRDALIAFLGSL